MKAMLFSELFVYSCNAQRDSYLRERDAADNAQAYFSYRGAADCCDFFANYCSELIFMGVTGRDAIVSRLLGEVKSRVDLEEARYWSSNSPSIYVDAVGWGIALRWLQALLVSYSDSRLVR